MHFRIGMDRDMTLIQMGHHILLFHLFLCYEHGYAGTLGIIVLLGNVQHLGADGVCHFLKNAGQSFGAVLFVNIGDVLLPFFLCAGIAHIIHIEAQGFCQVVESVKFKLTPFHEVNCHLPQRFLGWNTQIIS